MSAILGRFNLDDVPLSSEGFRAAFETIAFFGGDASDVWIADSIGLGQHLFRFTPESVYEQQPYLWDEAVIVADARIDNRGELCDRFGLSAAERVVTPDSHLILRAYRLWGAECAKHLLGDFAFAIWDQREQHLFCARDPIGARPFYYCHTASLFAFATNARALLAFSEVGWEVDEYAVASYLVWDITSEKKTFFKQLCILPPGQQLIVNKDGLKLQTYWSAEGLPEVRYKTLSEYSDHLRWLLEEAVVARVRTPYPIGAHISGGLDSSGAAVLANRVLRQQGRSLDMTYTWSPPVSDAYPHVKRDERDTIAAICAQENLPCQYGMATGQDCRDSISRDMGVEALPGLWEELPVLADAKQRGIRTILSGWGGDEVATFNGRGYLSYLFTRGRLLEIARITNRQAGGLRAARRSLQYVFRNVVVPLMPDTLYDRFDPNFKIDSRRVYIDPAFEARYPDLRSFRGMLRREFPDPRKMQTLLLENGHIAERMEIWAAWSADYQVIHTYPLTDRRLIEFALGVPRELQYQEGTWRYLFREAMKGILPRMPRKADPVNETKRLDCYLECWKIFAKEVRDGQWSQDDTPWLDTPALRQKLTAIPENMTRKELLEFAPMLPAMRVWHLWQRYGTAVNRVGENQVS